MALKKQSTYEMTLPIIPTDHIGNSPYTRKSKRFVPSYCDENVNMFDLLSMEYARLWTIEKEQFIKQSVATKEKKRTLMRRFVPKHQHNNPRLRVPDTRAMKKTSKYDHIQSRYLDYTKRSHQEKCWKSFVNSTFLNEVTVWIVYLVSSFNFFFVIV